MRCVLTILRVAASMSLTQVISLIYYGPKKRQPIENRYRYRQCNWKEKKETERRKRKEEAQGKEARSNEVIDNYLLIGSPTI